MMTKSARDKYIFTAIAKAMVKRAGSMPPDIQLQLDAAGDEGVDRLTSALDLGRTSRGEFPRLTRTPISKDTVTAYKPDSIVDRTIAAANKPVPINRGAELKAMLSKVAPWAAVPAAVAGGYSLVNPKARKHLARNILIAGMLGVGTHAGLRYLGNRYGDALKADLARRESQLNFNSI